ncbi:MAG: ferric reductase-like transmembrane domain-containing protein [Myxococcales bacterium]|nr:ferric reductase-like transmembrane domain-containing protein [Myxococcales bacterium]
MRKTILLGLALGALALLALGAVGARLGVVVAPPRPDGPWAWVAARAAGVTALVALTLDALAGLVLSTGALDRWLARARSIELHQTLSRFALGLTAGHVLLLLADGYIRYDLFDALVPGVSSYRPWAVAAGIVAAYLAVVVHVSFGWRARLGTRTWRRLHYLSFAVLIGALGHGLAAGTDTGRPGLRALYVVLAGSVAALVAVRALTAIRARAARPA